MWWAYTWGGAYIRGAYIRRFTVLVNKLEAFFSHATEVKFYKNVGEL